MPIFDQGYQHWSGHLAGHAWRWLAIARHGVRSGMKIRVMRIFLFVAWLPALALALMLCFWGLLERKSELVAPLTQILTFLGPDILANPKNFRVEIWTIAYDYFLLTELRLSMVLVLLVGPTLISEDLRFNALPLYFSRPMRRIDYFFGKLGVIAAFIAMVIVVPAVIAYVLGLLFSLDITILRDTFRLLLSSILYGLLVALSAGLLVLALSSLSRNSRYVVLFWLGIMFVSGISSKVLQEVARDQRRHAYFSQAAFQRVQPPDYSATNTTAERNPQQRAWQQAQQKAFEDFQAAEIQAAKRDWRPAVSYTTDLSRVGQHLLGTNACWERLSLLIPKSRREPFLHDYAGYQYPWYWSAAVLVSLLAVSAFILNVRVKSLDRLR